MKTTHQSWHQFFLRRSRRAQLRIERRLARLGITLGEYRDGAEMEYQGEGSDWLR